MSIAPEQPAFRATALRLTDVEKEKVWRVFGPVDRQLARLATTMMRSLTVADNKDVVQESFMLFAHRATRGGLKCLGNRRIADIDDSELDQRIPLCRAYLTCVVVRKCCWFHRKEKSHPLAVRERVKENVQRSEPDPAEALSREESVNGLQRAVLSLPAHLQKVLTLHYYGRSSEEEIAAALDIPLGTVKSRLRGSRKLLRPRLSLEIVEDLA